MTATDELRSLLDERGIEWNGFEPNPWVKTTSWNIDASDPKYGVEAGFDEFDDGVTLLRFWNATPEQSIDATLGAGTCHNASKVMDEHGQARFACSECGAWIDSRMLWNPEYRNGESPWVNDCKLNFCPNCGRKVVD